jgi:hypothetical protein
MRLDWKNSQWNHDIDRGSVGCSASSESLIRAGRARCAEREMRSAPWGDLCACWRDELDEQSCCCCVLHS